MRRKGKGPLKEVEPLCRDVSGSLTIRRLELSGLLAKDPQVTAGSRLTRGSTLNFYAASLKEQHCNPDSFM